MAHVEACQVWIEQRSEELNGEGKGSYEIGKTLAAEIRKLFRVEIKPRTLERRDRRRREKSGTNVPSSPESDAYSRSDAAIRQLEKIPLTDPKRRDALRRVHLWTSIHLTEDRKTNMSADGEPKQERTGNKPTWTLVSVKPFDESRVQG